MLSFCICTADAFQGDPLALSREVYFSVLVFSGVEVNSTPRLPLATGAALLMRPLAPACCQGAVGNLSAINCLQAKAFQGDPLALSYWLASNMPLEDDTRQKLLECPSVSARWGNPWPAEHWGGGRCLGSH